jgi:hypothetical protein
MLGGVRQITSRPAGEMPGPRGRTPGGEWCAMAWGLSEPNLARSKAVLKVGEERLIPFEGCSHEIKMLWGAPWGDRERC